MAFKKREQAALPDPETPKLALSIAGTDSFMRDLIQRPRRLRRSENLRALVRETRLSADDFVLPLFACSGKSVRREISSMPGVHNLSVDEIAREAAEAEQAGIKALMLFGLAESKYEGGSGAYHVYGIVQQYGGQIVIHSEPGRGARFEILLPAARA